MNNEKDSAKQTNNKIIIIVLIIIILALSIIGVFIMTSKEEPKKKTKVEPKEYTSEYRLSSNGLEDFDLHFLQLDNNKKNKIYSPLSIKYALEMLAEGADGNSRRQLDALIGDYISKKYTNSKNLSLANAFFIKDKIKKDIKKDYINLLKDKYNAEVIFDNFKNPDNVNNWVKNKTLDLIPKIVKDINDYDFLLINALAIDMEWNKELQSEDEDYNVYLKNEEFKYTKDSYPLSSIYVHNLDEFGYRSIEFEGTKNKSKAVRLASVANKYDVVKTIGEDNIRNTIKEKYSAWANTEIGKKCTASTQYSKKYPSDVNEYVDNYIKDIDSNYKHMSSSTDFSFYDDDDIKVFAKDYKKYDGNQLQYIAIMPKKEKLTDFINNTNSTKLNETINNLKDLELDSFEEGYLTIIEGNIPMFKYEYELDLKDNLKKIGITDVFNEKKSDLSKMIAKKAYIDLVLHKANIEFDNKGTKASAATVIGGIEATSIGGDEELRCDFEYKYEVPVKHIDISFDKPYLYIIRDKSSGEVWFTGTVYKPTEMKYDWED